jgi:hypothetical protein
MKEFGGKKERKKEREGERKKLMERRIKRVKKEL